MSEKVIISEIDGNEENGQKYFNLNSLRVKDCLGCWSCWWKTPGRCVQKELDEFYTAYINADTVIFITKPEHGFVSAQVKTLFDRMIPLFLPYTEFRDGGTYHTTRYPKYPDIIFCYDYEFEDEEDYKIFHDYILKVFDQFYSKNIRICSLDEFKKAGAR